MSDKLYQEAYEKFNDKQKDTMYDLYMTGINHDGHSWVTYGDVEKSVAIVAEEAYEMGIADSSKAVMPFVEWLVTILTDEQMEQVLDKLEGILKKGEDNA